MMWRNPPETVALPETVAPGGIAAKSAVAGGVVAGIGVLAAIIGAIVGQVGRGMQGRVV